MKERLLTTIQKILGHAVAFTVCIWMIRIYVGISIAGRINGNLFSPLLRGIFEDVGLSITVTLCVLAVSALIAIVSSRVATIVSLILFAFALVVDFGVHQYFIVTLIPLSTDLFGYTFDDIVTTVGSSGGTSAFTIVMCLLCLIVFFTLTLSKLKISFFEKFTLKAVVMTLAMTMLAGFLPWSTQPEDFEDDISYYIAVNKLRYLTSQTTEYIADFSNQPNYATNSYPLLRKINYTDSLGVYFNRGIGYPNLVFIVIEGMGRDFCGPNAAYGGFTPFLDSLAQKSLYWQNGLSNAGRTFGAAPSILGSLPYGRNGFMSYGNEMPDHQTLVTLLKPYGYQSNFFYGGNPNFDNLDLFLERQGVDYFLNETNFPPSLQNKKMYWGYPDRELFQTGLEKIGPSTTPRLDFYLTVSTHEPFVCPDSLFVKRAREIVNAISDTKKKQIVSAQQNIFECLLYTDDAVKNLIEGYSKRSDFSNTIFVITGDHRLIPVAQNNKISRFHVPIMIYSPLIKKPETFSALTTHSSILPALLGLLNSQYNMKFPESLPLIASSISNTKEFSSELNIALIRNKNEVKDFISGNYLLSDDRLYTILPDMNLKVTENAEVKENLRSRLKKFQNASLYALKNNKLDSVETRNVASFTLTPSEEAYLTRENISKLEVDQQFKTARDVAFNDRYAESRAILKYLLNRSPNYHDARILMARTYAWDKHYDSAKILLKQTIQRAPNYGDSFSALSDVFYWEDSLKQSLTATDRGLTSNASNGDLLARKARALDALGEKKNAKSILDTLRKRGVENEVTLQLNRKFKNP